MATSLFTDKLAKSAKMHELAAKMLDGVDLNEDQQKIILNNIQQITEAQDGAGLKENKEDEMLSHCK